MTAIINSYSKSRSGFILIKKSNNETLNYNKKGFNKNKPQIFKTVFQTSKILDDYILLFPNNWQKTYISTPPIIFAAKTEIEFLQIQFLSNSIEEQIMFDFSKDSIFNMNIDNKPITLMVSLNLGQ